MAIQPTYPGVYVQEVPSGVRTIAGVSTSIAVFIGRTRKGPLTEPVRCTTFSDFERAFSSEDPRGNAVGASGMARAVRLFFQNGGTDCYAFRIANGAVTASTALSNGSADVLAVTAKFAGSIGNTIRLAVNHNTRLPNSTFNLEVYRWVPNSAGQMVKTEVENWLNLSMDPVSQQYAVDVVRKGSALINLAALPGAAPTSSISQASLEVPNNDAQAFWQGWRQILMGTGLSSIPGVTTSGTYVGSAEKTYSFKIAAGGVVGTDAIAIDWNDGLENVGTLPLPVGYTADEPVVVAEGLSLAFAAGTLATDGAFTVDVQPAATQFRLSINKGLSYEDVDLIGIDFDTDPLFNNTPAGAKANLAGAIAGRINTLLAPAGAEVEVTMEDVAPTGASALLRITSITDNDLQVQSASVHDLAGVIGLGAGRGLETSRFTNARPAAIEIVNFGTTGQDGAPVLLENYDEAYLLIDREVDLFNLLLLPQDSEHSAATTESLWGPASIFCLQRRAFLLMDPPESWDNVQRATHLAEGVNRLRIGLVKDHSAIFYPRIIIKERGVDVHVGPSGAIAGLMARIDASRGVWKAPAGTEADLRGVNGIQYRFSDRENGVLNPQAVNTIRIFPNGIVHWGARTMDGDDDFGSEWKYIPVRRTALYIEESLYRGLKWVVFEPNDEPLWAQIRLNVGVFMHNLFRQGAFQGQKKSDAYFVKCDRETTTQADINLGIVNVWVGFAPLKPAEFVILYLQQIAGNLLV